MLVRVVREVTAARTDVRSGRSGLRSRRGIPLVPHPPGVA